MKLVTTCLALLVLAGCATAPPTARDDRYFDDARFKPPSERIVAVDAFALSDDMRRYVNTEIAAQAKTKGKHRALIDALYGKGAELRLEYDAEYTRNAAQAFAARAGNCLSFVLMTAAFAKELGIHVSYQKVFVDDIWGRTGDLYLAIGHVNITLSRSNFEELPTGFRTVLRPHEYETTINFLPERDLRAARTVGISEGTVLAMFLNNRAVEALARGRVDDAYWWTREAITQSPQYLPAYNTLGVVYVRHGEPDLASRAFARVLESEPFNTEALSNQVDVLASLGRRDESARLAATLARIEPEPPFMHFRRGMALLRSGEYQAAKNAFEREVARAPEYHEFHFWLAIAAANVGEAELAKKHLELALQNSTTRRDQDIYAAKLARLKHLREGAEAPHASPGS